MRSKASIFNHPLHPMLVPLPIGLWIFSLVADIIAMVKGDLIWSSAALYTMAAGIIGALLAALPGFVDLFTMPPSHAKRLGIWHMAINLTIVVLFVINFLLRHDTPGPPGAGLLILSIVAILMLGVSGWLGGELVYVHGVAVEPADGKKKPS